MEIGQCLGDLSMLTANNIHKAYRLNKKEQKLQHAKHIQVLKGVSFNCKPGTVTGLLGVNGAGKTTTLRTLTGAISADKGNVTLDGLDVHTNKQAALGLGFHSASTALYKRLSVLANLEFFGGLYGLKGANLTARVNELADRLGFAHYLEKRVKDLSTGMLQKAAIARAILHDPQIIILDEPTTGLDVMASANIIDFIRQQKELGKTILFSTHNMHEVESLCDSIVVLHKGVVHFDGTLDDFCGGKDLARTITHVLSDKPV